MTSATVSHSSKDKDRIDFLLNRIVDNPLDFNDTLFQELVRDDSVLVFQDLRHIVCRIFDINETILKKESEADNILNRISQRSRVKRFYRRFRNGFRKERGKMVIVAEGDSWFEFPYVINDILDHLEKIPAYNIYSLAFAGDWITNIIYDGKYVEKLSTINPDVFLVSGGGNDLVGSDRLGIMVNAECNCRRRYEDINDIRTAITSVYSNDNSAMLTESELVVFHDIQKCIQPAFYSFLWIMKLQYTIMFQSIHKKHKNLKIITQAYDYAIPSPHYNGSVWSLQYWVNRFAGTGSWLYIPLMMNGISDPKLQQAIIRFMIFEFNLMFAQIANTMHNVFHIDCRGVAQTSDDWYDELHLKSSKFAQIAAAYKDCINRDKDSDRSKIYFARNAGG